MKRVLILLIITTICASSLSADANTVYIPQTTLNIANSGYSNCLSSKIVRVAIGSQDFSTYERQSAEIYGTGEFEIYNGENYITTYDRENVIKISMKDKNLILTDCEDKEIANVTGPIIFKTDYGFLGIKDLKRGGKDAVYRGQLELIPTVHNEKFYIVNALELEDYLKGVVPNEMPVHFGLEALKAQSVAARNYVLSPRVKANSNYDVVDSVASQVYFGANTERELSNQAVNETSGIVATYDWELILAQYSSTAGGYTESYENAFSDPLTKEFPSTPKAYLKAKPDYPEIEPLNSEEAAEKFYKSSPKSFDMNSSYYRWEREWSAKELQTEIQNHIAAQSTTGFVKPAVQKGEVIGNIKNLNVLQRGISGKIMQLEIITDKETYIAKKELVIRRLLTHKGKALPSANMVFEHKYDENGNLESVKAYGGGFGHGVGLSQFGAGYMATELKMPYEKILKHYYSGISLTTEPFILSSNNNNISQTFYTKDRNAELVIDNKYKIDYINVKINNCDETIKLNKSERLNRIDISKYIKKGMNTITFIYPDSQDKNKGLRMYIEIAGNDE